MASACDTIHETKIPVRAALSIYRLGTSGDQLLAQEELTGELVAQGLVLDAASVDLRLWKDGYSVHLHSERGGAFALQPVLAPALGGHLVGVRPLD